MDIRLLKQFVAVYEERSISGAAVRSFISQPALSNSLRQLEEELGCLLFNRSKQGVIPTAQAEQLYPMALHMISELNSIPNLFQGRQSTEALRLTVMPELPQRYLARVFKKIHQILPEIELDLTTQSTDAHARILLENMKEQDELFLPLWHENYVFCVHKNHPLSSHELITLSHLNNQPFIICPPCEAHQRTLGLLGQQGMAVNIVARVETKHQVAMLIMAETGVSFLPEGMVAEWPELVMRPFQGMSDYRQVGLAWPSATVPSPVLNRLLSAFKEGSLVQESVNIHTSIE
ncbi:LysR family transcriptional regulator [Endozoicomonas sp. Mp262]|uniref:LysR family transcriptional regulator n=1 Tax=Endozoicomonas sp. Mp262 TaxID=2919499 RepID=UPI0021E0C8A5